MLSAVVRAAIAISIAALWASSDQTAPVAGGAGEVRALWVVRTTLTSPAAVDSMVLSARAGGFNTLLVQIRGRGDAYFQDGIEPRAAGLSAQPTFDPLARTIARAHDAGLAVHAWINVNLVAGTELPSARGHVIYRHPEWLMVPRTLADDLARADPRTRSYLSRVARDARARSNEVEGLYISPVATGSADYTVNIVRNIAERYRVDGVHLDYVRYPDEDFDYGRDTLASFKREVFADFNAVDRRRYDARLANDPTLLTRVFPDRFRALRRERLTTLVARLRDTVKAALPAAVLSAAVVPDPVEAPERKLQNWPAWAERDLIDVICPMAYTTDAAIFAAQIAAAQRAAAGHPVWAGIGAYRLSPAQIADDVQAARRAGAAGVILFSYDSLADPSRGPNYLRRVGRAAFTQ